MTLAQARWQLINLRRVAFQPRTCPAAIPISASQILILGGEKVTQQVVIFDTQNNTCETKRQSAGKYYIIFSGNRCVMPSPGVVIASGYNYNISKHYLFRY